MTSRLELYNEALLHCGERPLSSLSEAVKSRRVLDQAYNAGLIQKCLEEAQWRWASRTQQLDYDSSIAPDFGYQRAFPHPDDWVSWMAVCSDEFLRVPLLQYHDEAHHLYCDLDTIYVRFVSNDAAYGLNVNDWPGWFADFVAADLARRTVWDITGKVERLEKIEKIRDQYKLKAINKDKSTEPTQFPPTGSWASARHGTRRRGPMTNRPGDPS